MWAYVRRSAAAILRVYTLYEPLRAFMIAAAAVALVALVIWARFLYFFAIGEGSGHVQSLILGATLFIVATQLAALGVIGDVLAGMRVLQQRTLERVRRLELKLGVPPSNYEPGAAPADDSEQRDPANRQAVAPGVAAAQAAARSASDHSGEA